MVAEWSVECSVEDPVLVVPWSVAESVTESDSEIAARSAATLSDFVDLRENPYDLDQIPEADLYPPLMQALRALNAARSAVFTAKCDAWVLDSEELQDLRHRLDIAAEDAQDAHDSTGSGFASYIDLIWRDRSIFASFHQSEQLLHRMVRLAAGIDQPFAMLDCVLRPAMVDLIGPQEGFAITLYIKAFGPDAFTARQQWAAALEAVVSLLRGRDVSLG